MKKLLVLIIVILLIIPIIMGSNGQIADETINITPIKVNETQFDITFVLDQRWTSGNLDSFVIGKGYYQLLKFTIHDNITNPFGTNHYYKVRVQFDLVNTIFDPDYEEIIIQDGTTEIIPVNLDVDKNYQLNMTYHLLSINNNASLITLNTSVENYLVPTADYNLGQRSYRIKTLPTKSMYNITGSSFSWVNLPRSYLLLDTNLLNNGSFDASISVELKVNTFADDNDRIRMTISGDADSSVLESLTSLSVKTAISPILDIDFTFLGEYISFEITQVTINIGTDIYGDQFVLPSSLPPAGVIVAISFYLGGIGVVILYMRAQNWIVEEKNSW